MNLKFEPVWYRPQPKPDRTSLTFGPVPTGQVNPGRYSLSPSRLRFPLHCDSDPHAALLDEDTSSSKYAPLIPSFPSVTDVIKFLLISRDEDTGDEDASAAKVD